MGSEIFCLIQGLDCKTVRFFLKICKEIGNRGVRVLLARGARAGRVRKEEVGSEVEALAKRFKVYGHEIYPA